MESRIVFRIRGGIRLKKRVTQFLSRIFRRRILLRLRRPLIKVNALSRAFRGWGAKLRERLHRFGPGSGYSRLGRPAWDEENAVPKGHLAVYVGRKEEEGWAERVVVPVVHINHPLFVRLLKETEEKYGFDHPGGITVPCHVSEFERVQSSIAATARGKLSPRWC